MIVILNDKNLNIVLYEPEIAQNVGAIIRTCVALNAKLHIIEPLGFIFDDRFVNRSSANYVEYADYVLYSDYQEFLEMNKEANIFYATRYGKQAHSDIDFKKYLNTKIYIMFGKESSGIPYEILKSNLDKCFRIPMHQYVRSLNIANTVGIVGYEIMRQWKYDNLSLEEVQKGKNFLEE